MGTNVERDRAFEGERCWVEIETRSQGVIEMAERSWKSEVRRLTWRVVVQSKRSQGKVGGGRNRSCSQKLDDCALTLSGRLDLPCRHSTDDLKLCYHLILGDCNEKASERGERREKKTTNDEGERSAADAAARAAESSASAWSSPSPSELDKVGLLEPDCDRYSASNELSPE